MSDKSSIEWTDATWNPIAGCSLVSPGCTNCYAMRSVAPRLSANPATPHYHGTVAKSKGGPVWTGKIGIAADRVLRQPLRWRRPRRIFVNSTSDLFHEGVPDAVIFRIIAVMALCPQHTFQILTKRPSRMQECFSRPLIHSDMAAEAMGLQKPFAMVERGGLDTQWPLPNVWLGTSVEDQQRADERRGVMAELAEAGWSTFVSYEPALGPVDWEGWEFLRWLISGGESGRGARPSHPDWHRTARDFCSGIGIPYHFKQWGEWLPFGQSGFNHWSAHNVAGNGAGERPWLGHAHFNDGQRGPETHVIGPVLTTNIGNLLQSVKLGKRAAGRLLDGIEHNGMPERTP